MFGFPFWSVEGMIEEGLADAEIAARTGFPLQRIAAVRSIHTRRPPLYPAVRDQMSVEEWRNRYWHTDEEVAWQGERERQPVSRASELVLEDLHRRLEDRLAPAATKVLGRRLKFAQPWGEISVNVGTSARAAMPKKDWFSVTMWWTFASKDPKRRHTDKIGYLTIDGMDRWWDICGGKLSLEMPFRSRDSDVALEFYDDAVASFLGFATDHRFTDVRSHLEAYGVEWMLTF